MASTGAHQGKRLEHPIHWCGMKQLYPVYISSMSNQAGTLRDRFFLTMHGASGSGTACCRADSGLGVFQGKTRVHPSTTVMSLIPTRNRRYTQLSLSELSGILPTLCGVMRFTAIEPPSEPPSNQVGFAFSACRKPTK